MIVLESTFPKNYREEEIAKILNYAQTGKFCQVICVPGGGKATIMRILAHNREVLKYHLKEKEGVFRFVYINFQELANFSETEVLEFFFLSLTDNKPGAKDPLLITKEIKEFVNKFTEGQNLVLLFDHFDQYQNQLPRSFFELLKNLSTIAKYKFSCIFGTRRDLSELLDSDVLKQYYDFFIGNTVYVAINNEQATNILFAQIEKVFQKKLSADLKTKIITLTGGHAKLTKVISELVLMDNINPDAQELLAKPLIRATLFELWLYLTPQEQQTLKNIPSKTNPLDEQSVSSLKNLGLISNDIDFSIPLFEKFVEKTAQTDKQTSIYFDKERKTIVKNNNPISDLLSPQEFRLLKFFIENNEKVIQRDDVLEIAWPDAKLAEGISEEAIDQMIYRLRKKIEDDPRNPKHILTIKGQGWRFND